MADYVLKEGERLIREQRIESFRGEEFDCLHFAIKDVNDEMWTTTELDECNQNQIYNSYRQRHSFPFPDEIKALREYYGVSAAKMSEIMGFGANQWRYYEDGMVPSVSNARAIVAIRQKKVFLDFLDSSRNVIGDKAYSRIKDNVESKDEFQKPQSPTEISGFVSFSTEKVSEIVKYFISELGSTFVTKMNKLLFYSDFIHYKHTAGGITGIQYKAMPYGPVPERFGALYDSLSAVECEDFVYPNGTGGVRLTSTEAPDLSLFSEQEIAVLKEVCNRFQNSSAGEISDVSHKEKGWLECKANRSLIPYSYAFDLNE